MPDNPSSAAQPNSGPAPAELNFDQPTAENPRIRRRSLKAKSAGLKPATAPTSARELEREAPPLSAEAAVRPAPATESRPVAKEQPPTKSVPVAPPRTKPTISLTSTPAASVTSNRPATASTPSTPPVATASAGAGPKTTSSSTPTTSPHGTRPATLYYSSYPRKETSSSMKTNSAPSPAASSTPPPSAQAAARPAPAATRPVTVSPTPAPARSAASPIDYRANVDRQTREQKSVGNILSYVVYALIFVMVAGAALAAYGGKIIFDKLHDQSQTLGDLDSKYSLANKDLTVRLGAVQDSLTQAQASINRQQELINKQQEDISRLLVVNTDNANALKAEKLSRTQETAALRARLRDLENKNSSTSQKY